MKPITHILTILSLALSAILMAAADPQQMTAVFVNVHPRDEIALYWVNPELEEDDPERLVSSWFIRYYLSTNE
jgi:hypothetical protein